MIHNCVESRLNNTRRTRKNQIESQEQEKNDGSLCPSANDEITRTDTQKWGGNEETAKVVRLSTRKTSVAGSEAEHPAKRAAPLLVRGRRRRIFSPFVPGGISHCDTSSVYSRSHRYIELIFLQRHFATLGTRIAGGSWPPPCVFFRLLANSDLLQPSQFQTDNSQS